MPQGQTLAQKVRSKYPGVYDDLSDTDLESKVKAKFPGVYDDIPTSAPTASQPTAPTQGGGLLESAVNFGKGVVKAPLAIAETAGKLVHMIPGVSTAVDALYGTPGLSEASFRQADEDLKPKTGAETAGRIVGDIATAWVPAGAVTRGAKMAAAAAPRFTAPLARGAVEAAGAGAIAAAQGYDPTAAAVTGGLLGTGAGAARTLASKLKKGGEASMIAALGPAGRGSGPSGTNQVEMAKKVAPELLKRGFKATSHEDALSKIGDAVTKASDEIDRVMTSLPAGTRVRTKPIIEALNAVQAQGKVRGVAVGTGKIAEDVIGSVVRDLKKIGPSMTPDDAVRFRRMIGPLAKWSNLVGPAENVKAEAYKDIYNGIRTAIEDLDPAIHGANKEMSFWLNVRDLIERSSRRPQPPSSGTSGAILGGMAGVGSGALGTLGIAAIGRQMQRIMRSPGWRFVSANVKDDLADAIMKGDMGRFNQLAATVASQAGE